MANKPGSVPVATPEMLNAIRSEASQSYRDTVPHATPGNLQDVGNPILQYDAMANEFLNTLVNKIVIQLIERRLWESPLAILKRGEMPLGTDIEESHVNPATAEAYDGGETGMADILKMHKPDVATVYYRRNRQDKYPVTINNDELRGAFTAWSKMEDLIAAIVDSVYNGNTIDEYRYTQQIITDAVTAGRLPVQTIVNPIDQATGKQFMKTLRSLSLLFTFPSSNYNGYSQITGNSKRIEMTPISDQIIIIRADVASSIGVDVLSSLFHVEYADYMARQIIVDNFGDPKVLALLADKKAFLIYEQLRRFATFFNPSSLGWQYYFHAWDVFAMSPLKNCVVLKTA